MCQVSCIEHENHPFLSCSYKIIYWDAVDKLNKIGKRCRGNPQRGEGRFINGEEGVVYTPLQTMKEIGVFWLHCTAWH